MAKWTLREYINALREKIDEVGSTDYFKDNELTHYLNAGIHDMAHELQIEEYATLPIDTISFIDFKEVFVTSTEKLKQIQSRSHNFLNIRAIYIDGKKVKIGTLDSKKLYPDEHTAYIWGEKLYFTKAQSGTLEIFYYRTPGELVNDTDNTDVPDIYQHVPVIYAMAQCRRKDENEQAFAATMLDYNQAKTKMAMELANKSNDGYSYIQIEDYGSDM